MNTKKKLSVDQVRASMGISNPKPATINPPTMSAHANGGMGTGNLSADDSIIRLHIDSITTYKRNPRRKINELYVEIRESIRARGMDNIVKVTKRPGEDLYFPAAGGNTRILAQKELYAEGRDDKFAYIDCIFTEYTSEADILTRHIIENDTRADLVFWDKANAILELRGEIETELGAAVSNRQLAELLTARGVQIGRDVLRTYTFATEKLSDLGSATARLSGSNVREIILPNYQKLVRISEKFGIPAEQFHDGIARPVFRNADEKFNKAQEFNVDIFCADLTDATANALGQATPALRSMLSILEQTPDACKDDLTAPASLPESVSPASNTSETSPFSEETTDRDEVGELPSNGKATSPVGLGSVKSTEVLFANNLIRGNHTRQAQEESNQSFDLAENSNAETEQSRLSDSADEAVLSSASGTSAGHDIATKARFMSRLCEFSQIVNLQESIRFDDTFPLWFYADLPIPDKEGVPLDIESQAGGNPYRYMAWWYLAGLCGVLEDGSTARANLPLDSRISIAIADDDKWDDEIRNTIGEPLYEGTLGHLVTWLSDPNNPAGESLLSLLGALREVRAVCGPNSHAASRGEPT
jgi:ParB family protein of integrating conjugative element (PFGI_1 class)